MSRPWWNPKQSDYEGRYRLAALAFVAAVAALFWGFNSGSEILKTLLLSGGVGLLIGSGAFALSAWRSQIRAGKTSKN